MMGMASKRIVGAMEWGSVRLYNAFIENISDCVEMANTCSTLIAHIDEDNRGEIIIGDCQSDQSRAYDRSGKYTK